LPFPLNIVEISAHLSLKNNNLILFTTSKILKKYKKKVIKLSKYFFDKEVSILPSNEEFNK